MLVWQGTTKFAFFFLRPRLQNIQIGDGGTKRREILHDGTYGSRTSLPFWGRYTQGIPKIRNFGPKFWHQPAFLTLTDPRRGVLTLTDP